MSVNEKKRKRLTNMFLALCVDLQESEESMRKTTKIVAIFGTVKEMSEKLGKPLSTVRTWDTNGFIPRKNWRDIIEIAGSEYSHELSFDDFDETQEEIRA